MQAENFLSRRRSPRYGTRLIAYVHSEKSEFSGKLMDVSASGAGLELNPSMALLLGNSVWTLHVDQLLSVPFKRIWEKTGRVGVRFQINESRRQSIEAKLRTFERTSSDIWLSRD